jgi:16S rRNA (uracil1498-N3)-methyltransferase
MKHVFALYCPEISRVRRENNILFQGDTLWHRIVRVLRLRANEEIILFDAHMRVTIKLTEETFKNKTNFIHGEVLDCTPIQPEGSQVILLLCLLKKESFEESIYWAAELGAKVVQPVISQKVQRAWGGEREVSRLQTIIIGACEQAKNYTIPLLRPPVQLQSLHEDSNLKNINQAIYFDDTGESLFLNILNELSLNKPKTIALLIGPEGGITPEEQDYLRAHNFKSCVLTKTILRAHDAVAVGLGGIKCVV